MYEVKALGIDQSLNGTGLVYMKNGKVMAQTCVSFDQKKLMLPVYARVDKICKQVEDYIGFFEPDYVELEGLSYGSKGDVHTLAAVKGCIEHTLYRNGFSQANTLDLVSGCKRVWIVVPPGRMKAFNLGDGGAKKDTGYLLKVMEKTRLQFHNDNIADAYMHAMYISMLSRVMTGELLISGLPEWQQETLMKDGVNSRKGLSLNKALKLPEHEKLDLVRQMEL